MGTQQVLDKYSTSTHLYITSTHQVLNKHSFIHNKYSTSTRFYITSTQQVLNKYIQDLLVSGCFKKQSGRTSACRLKTSIFYSQRPLLGPDFTQSRRVCCCIILKLDQSIDNL